VAGVRAEGPGALTDPELRDELGECDEEEIEVEEELELLVEHEGEECEYIVLLVPDDVGWETTAGFLCKCEGWSAERGQA